jgi:hypothetical protein
MMKPETITMCSQALLDIMKSGGLVVGFIIYNDKNKQFEIAWAGSITDPEGAELILKSQLPFSVTTTQKTSKPI